MKGQTKITTSSGDRKNTEVTILIAKKFSAEQHLLSLVANFMCLRPNAKPSWPEDAIIVSNSRLDVSRLSNLSTRSPASSKPH